MGVGVGVVVVALEPPPPEEGGVTASVVTEFDCKESTVDESLKVVLTITEYIFSPSRSVIVHDVPTAVQLRVVPPFDEVAVAKY